MNPQKKLILFTSLTLLMSAILWGSLIIIGKPISNLETGDSFNPILGSLFIINGFMPSMIGLVLILKTEESPKSILSTLLPKKNQLSIVLEIFILFVVSFILQIILYEVFIGNYDYSSTIKNVYQVLPLLLLGPLSEEIGWRGYMQKQASQLYNPLKASIIIGLVWALWHLPLFFIKGTTQETNNVNFLTFSLLVLIVSWIMTYYYQKSNGSLFLSVFIHWIYTITMSFFIISTQYSLKTDFISILPFVLVGFYVFFRFQKRSSV